MPAAENPVDQRKLLAAAESEPEDLFRQTLKEHVNELTSEQELEQRRERQRRNRRASITEQPDGMFHLFAQLDPLDRQPGPQRPVRQGRRVVPRRRLQGSPDVTAAFRRRARRPRLQQRRRRLTGSEPN